MNWDGDTKSLSVDVYGDKLDFDGSSIPIPSIKPDSIGTFELFIPKSFGQFIGYSYEIESLVE